MYTHRPTYAGRSAIELPREAWAVLTLIICDYLVVVGMWTLAELILPEAGLGEARWGLAGAWILAFLREGLYPGYTLSQVERLRGYASGSTLAGMIMFAILPLLDSASLEAYGLVLAVVVLTVPVTYFLRLVTQRVLNSLKLWSRPVVIYGAGATGSNIAVYLKENPLQGLRPVAFFDDAPDLIGTLVNGLPVIGELSQAELYARQAGVNHLIIAIPGLRQAALKRLTSSDAQVFKHIQFVPDFPGLPLEAIRTGRLNNRLTLEVRTNLRLKRKQLLKRAFDLVAVSLGSLLISPLLLALALLIRLDSRGPVLYSQVRLGKGGSRFRIWKFRSMVADADELLDSHLLAYPELRSEWEANHKLENDPRVTRVGRFLRRTSLDELPQLINVFRGEMSLVGPRPIVDEEATRYGDEIDLYYLVRPGMTGYWQVSGRSDTSYISRVAMDNFYIRNWSVWFDIIILAATIRVVWAREGAY